MRVFLFPPTVILVTAVLLMSSGGPVQAAESPSGFRPALLFDVDQPIPDSGMSFQAVAAGGARAFASLSGQPVAEIVGATADRPDLDVAEATTRFALAEGYTALVGVGFSFAPVFAALAPRHPEVRFVLIDSVVAGANVQSMVFREEEGAYLMGVMAATTTRHDHIGFVGGWDSPLIRRFACGYIQGARSVTPDLTIDVSMAGWDPSAFNAPEIGYRLANEQFARGADIVFQAAGATGAGVIRAAAEREGSLAIGVDYNQNGAAPGHVLTSMLKRMDIAVFAALKALAAGTWTPGTQFLGLATGGVGWALDEHNVHLLSEDTYRAVEDAEFDIRIGRTRVAAYDDATGCPEHDFGLYAPGE
ncbi:BMP family lipoprotein [Roseospira visakhapatnamensis]|uniref:Basic membrane protein A n=1 Tax=Roseospira visakhapatnamensis TaxID=390880 RepID=A0A7W6RC89_9PROT|nr:BMP family ABC transporter substrate-binding protein [Roseospira visakhapatnamensis]MBB4265856.1 basic membrane protein A [Roseospira visakhapatnamensis]